MILHSINTLTDVESFIQQVAAEIDDFHPMMDFATYTRRNGRNTRYSPQDAAMRNDRLSRCIDVCLRHTMNAYGYLLDLYLSSKAEAEIQPKKALKIQTPIISPQQGRLAFA